MFALAFAAGFRDDAATAQRARTMVVGFPAVPSDGVATGSTSHATASILRWAVQHHDKTAAPIWDDERDFLFAGDVRLYNRPELLETFSNEVVSTETSDLALARLAYLRWGSEASCHLVGDFAFVVWDAHRRLLFASRDHLGVRPLYYCRLGHGIVLASDVRQILALLPRPFQVNSEAIRDLLAPPARSSGHTYFAGISALRPGHNLYASDASERQEFYWQPAIKTNSASYGENCEELRRLFRRAVHDRLSSEHPIIAHSSGGFDSSTIVMAAHEIYRLEGGRPSIIMASALAPGYPCDESRYMDAVAARVSFEGVRWSVLDSDASVLEEPSLAYPGFERGLAGGPLADINLAKERGARVLLAGVMGDEVLLAGNVLLDLFRGGHWMALGRESLTGDHRLSLRVRILARSMLGLAPPPVALRLQRQLAARPRPVPAWYGPLMREMYPPPHQQLPARMGLDWQSHVALTLWDRVTGTQTGHVVDWTVIYGSRHGIEVRLPYADVRLIEHMLSIPWEQRIPQGHLRRTGRDALGPLLPYEFNRRIGQQSWTPVWSRNARRALPCISRVLTEGEWLSAPFVDRAELQMMLRRNLASDVDGPNAESWVRLLDFTALESWLRRLI